ncbi:MAG: hypothetical protein COA78_22940 [Blastopirellula sp.]|nr:MAG: hypothetical protein COA78_22940 [Blastopirellula sp.]
MVNILRQSEITVLEFGERYSSLIEKKLSKDAQQIIGTVKSVGPPLVVFDLTQVQLIDSYFIRLLVRTWKLIKKRDGNIVLAGVNPECLKLLERLKIESLWERFPTRRKAINAMKNIEK